WGGAGRPGVAAGPGEVGVGGGTGDAEPGGDLLDRPADGEDAPLVEVAEQPYPLGAVQLRPVAVPVTRPGVDERLHHGVDAVGEHGRRGIRPAARGTG